MEPQTNNFDSVSPPKQLLIVPVRYYYFLFSIEHRSKIWIRMKLVSIHMCVTATIPHQALFQSVIFHSNYLLNVKMMISDKITLNFFLGRLSFSCVAHHSKRECFFFKLLKCSVVAAKIGMKRMNLINGSTQ